MKIYNRKINGVKLKAYNDSNTEWVVKAEGSEVEHRFLKNKWSMKDALELVARLSA